jgi:hypothetical protein
MTLQQDRISSGRPRDAHTGDSPAPALRLRLKPNEPGTGYVDGAWWPRSRDLAVELPGLLAVIAIRLGAIDRVVYDLGAWQPAPRRMTVQRRPVHLDGYRSQPVNTLYLIGLHRNRMVLLVIPPETDAGYAHSTMQTAAHPNSVLTANQLLRAGIRDTFDRTESATARERWDYEGGHAAAPGRAEHPQDAPPPRQSGA